MWSAKEIWEAGRAALAARYTAPAAPVAPAPVVEVEAEEFFDPTAFSFEARPYRITFRGGSSGEYDGSVLARQFPFDAKEVRRVEPVEEVGQGA
jgi:hypothetical protein